MRIAIAGLGPKGLFALERLLHRIAEDGARTGVRIDAFEPHPAPGAGPVYDPAQPGYLRMNYSDEQIDLWALGRAAVPPSSRRSYIDWGGDRGAGPGRYSARADVGRYLADGLRTLLRHAPPEVEVVVRPHRVEALRREGDGWRVVAAGVSDAPYDEVLLATGHARSWAGSLARSWSHAAPLVDSVFPVDATLAPAIVAPGATVAVRGFALTFLDAALALTEGRGGRFATTGHAYRLHYEPGPADAAVLVPYSRSGRPMLVKPRPQVAAAIGGLDEIAQAGRARLAGTTNLIDVIADVAAAALAAAGSPTPPSAPAFAARLTAIAAGGRWPAHGSPADELERSLQVATGLRAPDPAWALGHAWRATYPAIVARVSHGGLPARDWPGFRRLAAELERIAFGPSPENAARLLALMNAGRIDPGLLAGGRLMTRRGETWLCRGDVRRRVDVVVDAVLPPAGAVGVDDVLVGGLIEARVARVLPGGRGLDVAPDGGCRSADGTPAPGLAAIGRVTEDAVVGNDSLSRTLHPLADRWAARVAGRCAGARRDRALVA